MRFEWDAAKSKRNAEKRGVTFDEATTVFGDPLALTFDDVEHSGDEERYLTFGLSVAIRALVVAHTARGDTIRIISARPMTPRERSELPPNHWTPSLGAMMHLEVSDGEASIFSRVQA